MNTRENVLMPYQYLESLFCKDAKIEKKIKPKIPSRITNLSKEFNPEIATDLAKEFYLIQFDGLSKYKAKKQKGWTERQWVIAKSEYLAACGIKVELKLKELNPKIVEKIELSKDQESKLSNDAKIMYELISKGVNSKTIASQYRIYTNKQTRLRKEIRRVYEMV
jgi:hypothetical protein